MENSREYREQINVLTSQIRLEFLRHDQREPATKEQGDGDSLLTREGRRHAKEIGQIKSPNPNIGLVYGSPRVRAQETAMRQLFAGEEWLDESTSAPEMNKRIGSQLSYGKKVVVSDKLDFRTNVNPKFAEIYGKHYSVTKDTVPFLYYESDRLVRELKDAGDYSYTRLAANVADMIKKYIKVLPQWKKILENNSEKYKGVNELQRFLGTHSTVCESFLLKIIEKTEGGDAAKKFIDDLPDKNGIDFSDGISVVIVLKDEAVVVRVSFHDKVWVVGENIIDEIVQDRVKLDDEISSSATS